VRARTETAIALLLAAGVPWERPIGDDDLSGIVTMLARVSTLRADHWAQLATPSWRPVIDALTLAVASIAGIWTRPRTGLQQIESVLRWEREAGCAEDVVLVLSEAAWIAETGRVYLPCPTRCGIQSECPICHGVGVLTLRHDRWTHLRVASS